MSNKRKLTTILAVAGATVLAAGGSAFVTQTGLSLIDRSNNTEQGSEVAVNEKETEQPLTVEKFAATKDSFTVKPKSDTTKKDTKKSDSTTESEQSGENTAGDEGTVTDGFIEQFLGFPFKLHRSLRCPCIGIMTVCTSHWASFKEYYQSYSWSVYRTTTFN